MEMDPLKPDVREYFRRIGSKGGKASAAKRDMSELGQAGNKKRWANRTDKRKAKRGGDGES